MQKSNYLSQFLDLENINTGQKNFRISITSVKNMVNNKEYFLALCSEYAQLLEHWTDKAISETREAILILLDLENCKRIVTNQK